MVSSSEGATGSPPATASAVGPAGPLSTEQIRAFKREGYLVLRDVLDPELMERTRERFWSAAPPDMRRDDPRTWPGEFREEDGSGDWRDQRHGTIWEYREPGCEPWMLRMVPEHPPIRRILEQLLGSGMIRTPKAIRGLYSIRPERGVRRWPRQCHVDKHPFQVGVEAYVDDVEPGGGGLAVWPGSHRRFFPLFRSRYRFQPTDEYEPLIHELDRLEPIDCAGRAGDVVFFHHRLAHKAGHNDSDRIRMAVLHDCARVDLDPKLMDPPGDDLWVDWSDSVRAVPEDRSRSLLRT